MQKILTILFTFCLFHSFSQNKSAGFFYVRTTDSLPFLNYGTGDDRLGGAKMTYLDSNIILKVTDSFQTDYKVQLSQLHLAYIDKKNVTKTQEITKEQHLADSWKVYGDNLFDYVTIQLDEKLPYKSVMEIYPSEIVVDIFGAT